MLSLYREYPSLANKLPWVSLCALPTPIEAVPALAAALGLPALYVKRDDISGAHHGGNKVRKLEFLLADAQRRKRKEVLTFGYAGSNHAAATAFYAQELGMRSISMLLPQPNSPVVRQNLLLSHACQAELHQRATKSRLALATIGQLVRHAITRGRMPKMIPAGGSSPLGAVGFVNAAFELRDQVRDGLLPEPDAVYLALGSMGTAAGLLAGFAAAGMHTRVVGVQVTGPDVADHARTINLARATQALLHRHDLRFPKEPLDGSRLVVRTEFFGPGYGQKTPQGEEAAALMKAHCAIPLDGTYSAKAFAALVKDARDGVLRDQTPVYWDTFNSHDVTPFIHKIDFRALPPSFHSYFEETGAGGSAAG